MHASVTQTRTQAHAYTCVYVCVCVCVRPQQPIPLLYVPDDLAGKEVRAVAPPSRPMPRRPGRCRRPGVKYTFARRIASANRQLVKITRPQMSVFSCRRHQASIGMNGLLWALRTPG